MKGHFIFCNFLALLSSSTALHLIHTSSLLSFLFQFDIKQNACPNRSTWGQGEAVFVYLVSGWMINPLEMFTMKSLLTIPKQWSTPEENQIWFFLSKSNIPVPGSWTSQIHWSSQTWHAITMNYILISKRKVHLEDQLRISQSIARIQWEGVCTFDIPNKWGNKLSTVSKVHVFLLPNLWH